MTRFITEDEEICVPEWVTDLESFRRWSDDDSFPETGRISYLRGEVWIDMSKEQLFTHNQVKTEFIRVLAGLTVDDQAGRFFGDGAYVSSVDGDVSNQPDGTYVSLESFRTRRVRIIEGRQEGYVELEGSPDMVLEVVSRSSVEKDTVALRQAYASAGIREYWLVDARSTPLQFDILRLHGGHYRSTRKHLGWVRSEVFERWVRLTQQAGADGFPKFRLELREEKPA